MRIVDFYPSQGSYSPGEPVTFLVGLEAANSVSVMLQISIRHFSVELAAVEQTGQLIPGAQTIQVQWIPPINPAGYSAELRITSGAESLPPAATTAFDVLSSWIDFPRYGFLTDFSASRADPEVVLSALTRFHINGLQFYDWQYRHDRLLAPAEEYLDPLGRELSLASVRELVKTAHLHGMAAMPYLAIYAASAEFWRTYPEWALYDEEGSPIAFGENFLGLMNPSQASPWSRHLLNEGLQALKNIPFDGLHIDQYGDPKRAWDSQGNFVDLPKSFVDFIKAASAQHPNQTILFNAVGNWPIDTLAESAVDFLYIEVWPPEVEYRHLAEIVLNAIRLSHGKAVVIALYLPASRPANNLLADAVILACGGTRIELGEEARLLSDPYFPQHEQLSAEVLSELRKLSDFIVRNGEWLRPYNLSAVEKDLWSQGQLNPEYMNVDRSIWAVARSYPKATAIQLINFTNLNPHLRWDDAHAAPVSCHAITVRILRSNRPARIFWDSPERTDGQQLRFEYSNGLLTFQIPNINFTGLVVIHE